MAASNDTMAASNDPMAAFDDPVAAVEFYENWLEPPCPPAHLMAFDDPVDFDKHWLERNPVICIVCNHPVKSRWVSPSCCGESVYCRTCTKRITKDTAEKNLKTGEPYLWLCPVCRAKLHEVPKAAGDIALGPNNITRVHTQECWDPNTLAPINKGVRARLQHFAFEISRLPGTARVLCFAHITKNNNVHYWYRRGIHLDFPTSTLTPAEVEEQAVHQDKAVKHLHLALGQMGRAVYQLTVEERETMDILCNFRDTV